MFIRHTRNSWVDKEKGGCCFLPDHRSDYEQIQRLRPGLTLHRLRETALLVVQKGPLTPDRNAILNQFVRAAEER